MKRASAGMMAAVLVAATAASLTTGCSTIQKWFKELPDYGSITNLPPVIPPVVPPAATNEVPDSDEPFCDKSKEVRPPRCSDRSLPAGVLPGVTTHGGVILKLETKVCEAGKGMVTSGKCVITPQFAMKNGKPDFQVAFFSRLDPQDPLKYWIADAPYKSVITGQRIRWSYNHLYKQVCGMTNFYIVCYRASDRKVFSAEFVHTGAMDHR